MTTSTFIFVHNQDILLSLKEEKRFSKLKNLKYVFLGKREIEKVEKMDDVIIARNLPHNIEQHPWFCSFTGWYALWKNGLIDSHHVNLFEYDTHVGEDFLEVTGSLTQKDYDFIGYVPLPFEREFMTGEIVTNTIKSIKNHHGVNMWRTVRERQEKNKDEKWSSTSNSTFKVKSFNEYMEWFEKLIEDLKTDRMAGHAQERSITFFNILREKNVFLTENLLSHGMLSSHTKRA